MAHQNALGELPGGNGVLPLRIPNPTESVLISQVYSSDIGSSVKLWLSNFWPENHEVHLIRAAGTADQVVQTLPIHTLDRVAVDHLTCLFVPPVDPIKDFRTFPGLLNVTRSLRAPGGCPWDREQTHDTLKTHLIEETYEVIDALDQKDYTRLAEELGDLLFQVTIHSQVAAERDEFDVGDVIESVTTKLIRRHPHVFSDLDLPTSAAVLERWETIKQAEHLGRTSVLSGIPEAMPALPYSFAIQKRAANQGFEWADMDSLLSKADEELKELRSELGSENERDGRMEELGDLFFVLVSLGRRLKIDPEEALRRANRKFVSRFQHVEAIARSKDVRLPDLTPLELDTMWAEAKLEVDPS